MSARTCDECGSDTYFARNFGRVRDEAQFWRQKAQQLAAEVERLNLEAEFSQHRDRTDVAWLQSKVVAQKRELKRLNDKHNARLIREELDPQPDVEVLSVTQVEVERAHREAR